jgi:hypothetical protein
MARRATRRKVGAAARNAAHLAELQMLAPLVMAQRLGGLAAVTPVQAWFQWQRWAVEKAFVFSAAGTALLHESARTALGTMANQGPARVFTDAAGYGARASAKALAPLRRRVKRNARTR